MAGHNYIIETGIAVPADARYARRRVPHISDFPLHDMKPGDSIVIPATIANALFAYMREFQKKAKSMTAASCVAFLCRCRARNKKFTARERSNGDVRLWSIGFKSEKNGAAHG